MLTTRRHIVRLSLALTIMVQAAPIAQRLDAVADESVPLHAAPVGLGRSGAAVDELARIIRPITTITEFRNGKREFLRGNGFVVGRRYFTVHHNLGPAASSAPATMQTYLDGVPISPSYASAETDVAVFDLPADLCEQHCNDLSFGEMPELERDRRIYWVRTIDGTVAFDEGRVRHIALMGNAPLAPDAGGVQACRGNLIVEVDTPFVTGSSGAPVWDARTGRIIGIIQGNLERQGVRSGYFKPISCVVPLVGAITGRLS
jgi:hypothetical protein